MNKLVRQKFPLVKSRKQIDQIESKFLEKGINGGYKIALRYKRNVPETLNKIHLLYHFNANSDLEPIVEASEGVKLTVTKIKQNLHRVEIEKEVKVLENEVSEPIELFLHYKDGRSWDVWNDWSSSIYEEWVRNLRIQVLDKNEEPVLGYIPDINDKSRYMSPNKAVAGTEDRFTSENHTKPRVRIYNLGENTLNGFEVHYLIKSSTKPEVHQYWANQMEKSTIQVQEMPSDYWAIVIRYENIELLPGKVFDQIDFEYNLPGWIPMNVNDDPSYSKKGINYFNQNVAVYDLDGELISIFEPRLKPVEQTKLVVDSYENSNSANFSNPILRVRHIDGDPITGFIINYKFSSAEPPVVDQWNLERCQGKLSPLTNSEYLVKIICQNNIIEPNSYFPAYTINGDQGLSFALHYPNWSDWNKENDHSHPLNQKPYQENNLIWITNLDGELLGGNYAK